MGWMRHSMVVLAGTALTGCHLIFPFTVDPADPLDDGGVAELAVPDAAPADGALDATQGDGQSDGPLADKSLPHTEAAPPVLTWSTKKTSTTYGLHDIWGHKADDVYTVGYNCTVEHFGGVSWSPIKPKATCVNSTLYGVTAGIKSEVNIVGDNNTTITCDVGGCEHASFRDASKAGSDWRAITCAASGAPCFLAGNAGTTGQLFAIDAAGSWTKPCGIVNPPRLRGVARGTELYAVGEAGKVTVWTSGSSCSLRITAVTAWLNNVFVAGSQVFSVGEISKYGEGAILHSAGPGQPHNLVSSKVNGLLWGVWAASPTDVWIVGAKGTVLRYDGKAITKLPNASTTIPTAVTLLSVWGASPTQIFITSSEGKVYHATASP